MVAALAHVLPLTRVADDDEVLVARVLRGDALAFRDLYGRHSRYVAGVVYRLMGDDAELEDIVQDAFVRAAERLPSLREPAQLRAWLVTSAAAPPELDPPPARPGRPHRLRSARPGPRRRALRGARPDPRPAARAVDAAPRGGLSARGRGRVVRRVARDGQAADRRRAGPARSAAGRSDAMRSRPLGDVLARLDARRRGGTP